MGARFLGWDFFPTLHRHCRGVIGHPCNRQQDHHRHRGVAREAAPAKVWDKGHSCDASVKRFKQFVNERTGLSLEHAIDHLRSKDADVQSPRQLRGMGKLASSPSRRLGEVNPANAEHNPPIHGGNQINPAFPWSRNLKRAGEAEGDSPCSRGDCGRPATTITEL